MPSTLSLLLWATVASASAFGPRVASPDEDAVAEVYRRNGRAIRIPANVEVPSSSSSTTCTTHTRTVVVPPSSTVVAAQVTARGGFKAKTKNGGRTKPAKAAPSAAASVAAPDVDLGAVVVESSVAPEPTPAAVEPQATQPGRGGVVGKGGKRIRTKPAKPTSSATAAAASSVVADADPEVVVESSVAPAEVSSAEPASTAAAEPQTTAPSSSSARGRNRRPTRKATKTKPGKTTAAVGTTAVAPQDATASSSLPVTSASEAISSASSAPAESSASSSVASSSSAPPAVTGATGIPTANPTTPVPVSRAGGVLQPSAAAEAHQRDATATRAFSDVEIRAPNGQCLFIDPTAGDFRQNLVPVSLVDCTGSPNEKWDIITAGKHNKPGRKPATLVVSTLTQGCIAFDGRRQAGDTVTLFSCGGRADGSGETSPGQQFPYLGQLSFAFAPVSGRNTTCILPGNERLESGPCPTDGSQLFSIFP